MVARGAWAARRPGARPHWSRRSRRGSTPTRPRGLPLTRSPARCTRSCSPEPVRLVEGATAPADTAGALRTCCRRGGALAPACGRWHRFAPARAAVARGSRASPPLVVAGSVADWPGASRWSALRRVLVRWRHRGWRRLGRARPSRLGERPRRHPTQQPRGGLDVAQSTAARRPPSGGPQRCCECDRGGGGTDWRPCWLRSIARRDRAFAPATDGE